MNAWEPHGFQVAPGTPPDFDGRFEWRPRSTRSRLTGQANGAWKSVAARMQIWSGADQSVLSINDNDGRRFLFEKVDSHAAWVVKEHLGQNSRWRQTSDATEAVLAARKRTDVLLVRCEVTDSHLELSPRVPGRTAAIRGAALSLAHLIRRQACFALDVQTNELTVDIREVKVDDEAMFEIYLTDTLENGAGYCAWLGHGDHFQEYVLQPLMRAGKRREWLVEHATPTASDPDRRCDSSCYDCIRDYGNSNEHTFLDWRLGLDLLDVATTNDEPLGDLPAHWQTITQKIAKSLAAGLNGNVESIDGLTCVVQGQQLYLVLVHPFWPIDHSRLKMLAARLRVPLTDIPTADLFESARRPGQIITQACEGIPLTAAATQPTKATDDSASVRMSDVEGVEIDERFLLRVADARLSRLAESGEPLPFRRLPTDVAPETLQEEIIIAVHPEKDEPVVGKLKFQALQDAEGVLESVRVTLRAFSSAPMPREQWIVPVTQWPDAFSSLAVLDSNRG